MGRACYTQREIADAVGVDKSSTSRFLDGLLQNDKIDKMQQTLGIKIDPDFDTYARDLYDAEVSRLFVKSRCTANN